MNESERIRKIHELEQAGKFIAENLPPLLVGFHEGLKEHGMSDENAIKVVCAYVASLNAN